MSAFRALQRRNGRGRIEQQLDETPLILDRKADKVSLFDRPMRGISGGSDDEVAESPALKLGGAPYDGELCRGDACLDARGAMDFIGHRNSSLSNLTVRQCHVQVKVRPKMAKTYPGRGPSRRNQGRLEPDHGPGIPATGPGGAISVFAMLEPIAPCGDGRLAPRQADKSTEPLRPQPALGIRNAGDILTVL